MKLSEFLKTAKAKIDTEDKWCQGANAINEKGLEVTPTNPSACRFCTVGVIESGIDEQCELLALDLFEKLIKKNPFHNNLADFNDFNFHPRVMRLWDKAIAKAKEQESLVCA